MAMPASYNAGIRVGPPRIEGSKGSPAMLNDESGTLRAVAWSEICPWLKLFRCFRVAIRFRLLVSQ